MTTSVVRYQRYGPMNGRVRIKSRSPDASVAGRFVESDMLDIAGAH